MRYEALTSWHTSETPLEVLDFLREAMNVHFDHLRRVRLVIVCVPDGLSSMVSGLDERRVTFRGMPSRPDGARATDSFTGA